MAKTCPSCGYQPIGPYSDNCPICAEPVRNVRSDGAGAGGGFTPWVRYAVGAVLLSIAGCCGLGMWRMGSAINDSQHMMKEMMAKAEADRRARTIAVTATALVKEFQDDAAAAEKKYEGKFLELTGAVERQGKSANSPFVILRGDDAETPLKIECYDLFDADGDVPAKQIDKGKTITVRGTYAGRVTNLQVRGCVLVK